MKAQHWFAAIALVKLAAPAFAQQASPAGRVKVVSGSPHRPSRKTIRAEVGQSVFSRTVCAPARTAVSVSRSMTTPDCRLVPAAKFD